MIFQQFAFKNDFLFAYSANPKNTTETDSMKTWISYICFVKYENTEYGY